MLSSNLYLVTITRRRALSLLGGLAATALATPAISCGGNVPSATGSTPQAAGSPNNIADNDGTMGAYLMGTTPTNTRGPIVNFNQTLSGYPQWQIAEWADKYSIAGVAATDYASGSIEGLTFDGVGYEVPTHIVIRGNNDSMWLSMDTAPYYGNTPRQNGQPWPELHLSQGWGQPNMETGLLNFGSLGQLWYDVVFSVPYIVLEMTAAQYNPAIHIAHAMNGVTLQNQNTARKDYGKVLSLMCPFVNYADAVVPSGVTALPGNYAVSFGQQPFFGTEDARDGAWHTIHTDLVPLFNQAISMAQNSGYFTDTTPSDLMVTGVDPHWEMPGTFRAALVLQPMSLEVVLA